MKMCEGVLMKRSLCINPLFTLFLVQMLYVNNEKVVSSWRYGDRGFCLVGCINSSGRVWLSYSSSLFLGGTPSVGDLGGFGRFLWG